jgi:hypothetical protein
MEMQKEDKGNKTAFYIFIAQWFQYCGADCLLAVVAIF